MQDQFFFPTKKTKKWAVKESNKKSSEFKPLVPNFCPNINEDGTQCGRLMRRWDIYFYDKYQVCELCAQKMLAKKEENVQST